LVLPSMSVKRKVTVPVGRADMQWFLEIFHATRHFFGRKHFVDQNQCSDH